MTPPLKPLKTCVTSPVRIAGQTCMKPGVRQRIQWKQTM